MAQGRDSEDRWTDGQSAFDSPFLFQRPADREVLAAVPVSSSRGAGKVAPTPLMPYRVVLLPRKEGPPLSTGSRVRFYGQEGAPLDIEVPPPAEWESKP